MIQLGFSLGKLPQKPSLVFIVFVGIPVRADHSSQVFLLFSLPTPARLAIKLTHLSFCEMKVPIQSDMLTCRLRMTGSTTRTCTLAVKSNKRPLQRSSRDSQNCSLEDKAKGAKLHLDNRETSDIKKCLRTGKAHELNFLWPKALRLGHPKKPKNGPAKCHAPQISLHFPGACGTSTLLGGGGRKMGFVRGGRGINVYAENITHDDDDDDHHHHSYCR